MSIVKSARLNTVIGMTDGNSLTFLNLVVESSIGDFKTTAKISFICKGRGVPPKLIKSPFKLDRKIIQQMLDEAKLLLLPKNNESTKENNESTSVVYEFRGTFKENNESTKKKNKSTKTRKSTKTNKSSKPVVNTDEDSIMSA